MESSGVSGSFRATWNLLQRVKWCPLSRLAEEFGLGRLVKRNGSLSQQPKRSSDVFEVADESTVVGCLRR